MERKTFEDVTFELISRVSPIKLNRSEIPFDSVRELVIKEISARAKKPRKSDGGPCLTPLIRPTTNGHFHGNSTDAPETPGTTRNQQIVLDFQVLADDDDSQMSADLESEDSLSRFSADDDSRLLLGQTSKSNHGQEGKKTSCFRTKRLTDLRNSRLTSYQTSQFKELNCDERELPARFETMYSSLLESTPCPINMFFIILNSLDVYFRAKTWDNNCKKLTCEFLEESVLARCDELNEAHEAKEFSDELRVKEFMLQVLISLQLYQFQADQKYADDVVNKLRIIYMASEPQKMKNFLEEPVTDIFINHIPQCLATIFDELCITLPQDLAHFDNGFKVMDDSMLKARRNGHAKQLEQLLEETRDDVERPAAAAAKPNATTNKRKPVKREHPEGDRKASTNSSAEPQSPPRLRQRTTAGSTTSGARNVRVIQETPDEKIRSIKKELEDSDDIDESVMQTPIAKLRGSHRAKCSRRLSELVKVSEERATLPRKAAINAQKLLDGAECATPGSHNRRTSRQLLFANNTPSSAESGRQSVRIRANLEAKFTLVQSTLKKTTRVDVRVNGTFSGMKLRAIKKEVDDDDYDTSSNRTTPQKKNGTPPKNGERKRKLAAEADCKDEDATDELHGTRTRSFRRRGRWGQETEGSAGTATTTSVDLTQRNRSGRVVRAEYQNVYMSHLLLNVKNEDPLRNWDRSQIVGDFDEAIPRIMRLSKKWKDESGWYEDDSSSLTPEESRCNGDYPFEEEAED